MLFQELNLIYCRRTAIQNAGDYYYRIKTLVESKDNLKLR